VQTGAEWLETEYPTANRIIMGASAVSFRFH